MANARLHGETRRKPCEHIGEEKPRLRLLPAHPYDGTEDMVNEVKRLEARDFIIDTKKVFGP